MGTFRAKFLLVAIISLLAAPAWAQKVPDHLVGMAVDLIGASEGAIKDKAADKGPRGRIVGRASQGLDRAGLRKWTRGSTAVPGLGTKTAQAAGVGPLAPNQVPAMQTFLDSWVQGDAKAAVYQLHEDVGAPKPDPEEMTSILDELETLRTGALGGLDRGWERDESDDDRLVTIDFDPENFRFKVIVDDEGYEDDGKARTTIDGGVTMTLDEDGDDIELSATPDEDPVAAQTPDEVRAEEQATLEAIAGEWIDDLGGRWTLEVDAGARDRAGPEPPSGREAKKREIAAKKDELKRKQEELKAARTWVWRNLDTGEERRMKTFKRLSDPWDFVGEENAAPQSLHDDVARLMDELMDLRTEMPEQDVRDAPALPENDPATGSFPVVATEFYGDYGAVFREANLRNGVLRGRRTLLDSREIGEHLPLVVRQKLVRNWSPPEWFEIRLVTDPKTGERRFEGHRWRLHVTRDGWEPEVIKSIHTPYKYRLALTRDKMRVVDGAAEGEKP